MRKTAIAGFMAAMAAILVLPAVLAAQPTKEHEWLHQLAGQWDADIEIFAEPGKPPMKLKSTEHTRRIGGYWILSEGEVTGSPMPFKRALTLGYDPQKKKYVGTWVDSNSPNIGNYEGSLDEAGKTLTLEGDMPSPFVAGATVRMRQVIEIKSPDQKVLTTSVLGPDGNWLTLITLNARRKK